MTTETILSIAAIVVSVVSMIISAITSIKTSKINNIKDYKEYEKNITYFELSYKDERWLWELFNTDQFSKYNARSQKRILKWWDKYKKKHPTLLLEAQVEFKKREMLNSMHMRLGPKDIKTDKDKAKDDGSLDW